MKKNYPTVRPNGHSGQQCFPICPNFRVPDTLNVLKNCSNNNRNIAGQLTTKVVFEDVNGNKMTFHQRQQVLNLLNGCRTNFVVTDKGGYTPRRKTNVRRKN